MADSVKTFQVHLTAVMDGLVRASVCEITKLFQDTVNDYLVEISLNRKENEALKLRLRLTENKLRNERKYGLGWATSRRAAGLLGSDDSGRKKRRADISRGKQGNEWSGGAWEEGVGGEREEGRDVYLSHLPGGGEEEEEEMEERRRGEGKETANIKEELAEQEEGYRADSLRLIQEALQMDQTEPGTGTQSPAQGEVDPGPASAGSGSGGRSPAVLPGAWGAGPAPSEGTVGGVSTVGGSSDELSGLESALKAEREREEAESGLGSPAPVGAPGAHGSLEYVMSPKYIGLDGLCSSQRDPLSLRAHTPPPHGDPRPGWTKRPAEGRGGGESPGPEQEPDALQLPSAGGSSPGEESGGEGGDPLHFCAQCGGGFNAAADLAEHACPVAGERPFPCAACGRAFRHAWSLKGHECGRPAGRPHRCELCGKSFTHSRSLERHALVHTGERPHRCPQCGRSFSRLGNLERHQRIHTGERPYECGACGKRFSRVEYLKRHQHVHSGERDQQPAAGERDPLQCPHCSKTHSDPEELAQHQCFYSI